LTTTSRGVRYTAFTLAVVFANLAGAGSACASDVVPFNLDSDGGIVVSVGVTGSRGTDQFQFLLDTGSNGSVVSDEVVARVSAPVVAKASMTTAAGSEMLPIASIARLSLGSQHREGFMATVLAKATLGKLRVSGVLGQDFLASLNYTIDYKRKQLSWDAAHPREGDDGSKLILRQSQGRLLVELPQGRDSIVRFVPDSGAAGLVVFDRHVAGSPAVPLRPTVGLVGLTTLTGRRDVRTAIISRLQVGVAQFINEPAVVVDRVGPDAPEGDGLLPLSFFASVTFNAQERYLLLRK
jgi:predicted aspartyl protease